MLCFISCRLRVAYDDGLALLLVGRHVGGGVKPHDPAHEVEAHAEVPEDVAADDARLLEPRGLVYRLHVEHGGVDVPARVRAERHARQEHGLYVIREARRAVDAYAARLRELVHPLARGERLRDDGDARARVDDEVDGLLHAFEVDFAAPEAARSSAYGNLDCSRRSLGRARARFAAQERHRLPCVIDGREVLAQHRQADVAVHCLLVVEELTYVDGHALDLRLAHLHGLYEAVDYLEAAHAADSAREPAARDGLEVEAVCRRGRDDAHARARVDDEAQHLLRAVDAHADDWAVVDYLERDAHFVRAARVEQARLRAEVAQEVYEAAYARAAVCVGGRRDAQELLVGVGRLLVALEARGHLPEMVEVVGLVPVYEDRAAQSREARGQTVLVEVHHREARDSHRVVLSEAERRAELFDREPEVAGVEERRAEQRVRARVHRLDGEDA